MPFSSRRPCGFLDSLTLHTPAGRWNCCILVHFPLGENRGKKAEEDDTDTKTKAEEEMLIRVNEIKSLEPSNLLKKTRRNWSMVIGEERED